MRMANAARGAVRGKAEYLRHLERDVADAGVDHIERRRATIQTVAGRLHALSPLATLARGYAVAQDASSATLTSIKSFSTGMPFDSFCATVSFRRLPGM